MSSILIRTTAEQTAQSDLRLPFCTAVESRSEKLNRITTELIDLNKIERHDYMILFRIKLGLNRYGPAVPGVGDASSPAAYSASAEPKAKKTAFYIKEVRRFTDLGLKEAKELVEKTPVVLKKGIT